MDDLRIHLYRLDLGARSGGPVMGPISGFSQPGGLAYHSVMRRLIVADGHRVVQSVLVGRRNTVFRAWVGKNGKPPPLYTAFKADFGPR
eukprot:9469523-Pyramimonas_sp.AAC.1